VAQEIISNKDRVDVGKKRTGGIWKGGLSHKALNEGSKKSETGETPEKTIDPEKGKGDVEKGKESEKKI